MRPARILELVDQHVVIARLEPVAALRELVHLPQQVERPLEHIGKIENRALVQRAPVLRQRDPEHPLDAARHDRVEIAGKSVHHPFDGRSDLRHRGAVTPRGIDRRVMVCLVRVDRAGRAWPAIRRQEVRRDAIDQATHLGVGRLLGGREAAQFAAQQLITRVAGRAFLEKPGQAAGDGPQRVPERGQRPAADDPRGQIRWAALQKAVERAPCDEPPIEQGGQPLASSRQPELGEHQGHVRLGAGKVGKDPQRLIQRLLDQPGHFRLVGHLETGIDVRFEWELAQQGQTEGVDRADRNLAKPIAQVHPSPAIELGPQRRVAQLADDALAHFGGGLAGERHRQDVARLHPGTQQIEVARDQDRRLPSPRRRLEHNVVQGIDGEPACGFIGVGILDRARPLGFGRFRDHGGAGCDHFVGDADDDDRLGDPVWCGIDRGVEQ